ncbi:MAG TPA: WbqC family protein [Dysgonamonadaceae bacterium]|nr:WbqC family protein [Dysgonamonadaceae bacterium]
MQTVLLSSLYLAPIQYYSKLFRAENAIIEIYDNYQKQSYRNRCIIVGANGALHLSVPIGKPKGLKYKMKDIRIADHGDWQHLHWNAIISAYNSTPFFDYYRDDFHFFYKKKFTFLLDLNEQLRELICKLLGIDISITHTESFMEAIPSDIKDFRELIHPKRDWQELDSKFEAKPYYQVFDEKHGFITNASIIDLLFNMGNEARLYLQ